jgi:thioester reductase-like protein
MAGHDEVVFVTGGTGLVGGEYVRRLLTWQPDARAVLLVRGRNPRLVEARTRMLLSSLFPDDALRATVAPRVRFVNGSVTEPRLGLDERTFDELAGAVSAVVHCAADVRFDLSIDAARRVNVEGAKHALALSERAARHGRLRGHHHVSTYAVGAPGEPGAPVLEEPPRAGARYRNSYEQSKAEAETYLLERAGDVPLSIYRPSIIAGDSTTGWTLDFKVFYLLLKLYAEGVYPTSCPLLVRRGALADVVHIDHVADCLYALSSRTSATSGTIHQLVAADDVYEVGFGFERLVASLREALARHGKPVAPPLVIEEVDRITPELLREKITDPVAHDAVARLAPYLSTQHRYDDRNTRVALRGTGVRRRAIRDTRDQLADYCVRTAWGLRPEPRPTLGRSPAATGRSEEPAAHGAWT